MEGYLKKKKKKVGYSDSADDLYSWCNVVLPSGWNCMSYIQVVAVES